MSLKWFNYGSPCRPPLHILINFCVSSEGKVGLPLLACLSPPGGWAWANLLRAVASWAVSVLLGRGHSHLLPSPCFPEAGWVFLAYNYVVATAANC